MQHVLTLRFPRPVRRPGRALGLLARVRAGHRRAAPASRAAVPGAKPEGAVPFLVGRLGRDDKRMLVLDADRAGPPIPGPWDLRAVFSK